RHAGNVTKEHSGRVRNHLRAIHKSMRRRKADPSRREVQGIFELKSPTDWRML
ncbi:MAG: glycosyltransferase family 2 protein, partial [Mesorhizobium sp.]